MKPPRQFKGRYGYTTGTCATAALKGALLHLHGKRCETVRVKLPVGWEAEISLKEVSINGAKARASVVKDAGDDPDVTNGAEIRVEVELLPGEGKIIFRAGKGVGLVTKPGLGIPPGEPAITRVPRRMMKEAVREVLGEALRGLNVHVTISIPKGEELARKTLNARLGIVGGLSILGTKGIVIPFSTAAYKASIVKAFHVARALKIREVVLTTGGRSEAFCQKIFSELPEEAFVQVGDFVGFALRSARRNGFARVTLGMMLAKMAKIAAGLPNTHAKYGDVPFEKLLLLATESGTPKPVLRKLKLAHTARYFLEILKEEAPEVLPAFGQRICLEALRAARKFAGERVKIRAILLDFEGTPIALAEE